MGRKTCIERYSNISDVTQVAQYFPQHIFVTESEVKKTCMTGWTDNNPLLSILILKLISRFQLHQSECVCAQLQSQISVKVRSNIVTVNVKTDFFVLFFKDFERVIRAFCHGLIFVIPIEKCQCFSRLFLTFKWYKIQTFNWVHINVNMLLRL